MSCPSTRTNLVLALVLAVAGAVLVTRAARGERTAFSDPSLHQDGREMPRPLQMERTARG